MKELDPNSPAAKGYETPTYDGLRPRYKLFALHFSRNGCFEQAAVAAGYSVKTAPIYGFEIGRLPEMVKALEELQTRSLNSSEFSRAAAVDRMRAESLVSMGDLCEEVEYTLEGKTLRKWKPKSPDRIAPQFVCCLGLVTVSREGHAQFNTTAQKNSRELLAKYMKWDKEVADTVAPLMFDFSGLKGEVKP